MEIVRENKMKQTMRKILAVLSGKRIMTPDEYLREIYKLPADVYGGNVICSNCLTIMDNQLGYSVYILGKDSEVKQHYHVPIDKLIRWARAGRVYISY